MKRICRIMVICVLLMVTGIAYSQTSGNQSGYATYTINEGSTITLHGNTDHAAAYQWYKDGMKINGAILKDYTVNLAGVYTVMAYNANGCPSDMSEGVQVVVNAAITQVTKPDTAVDLQITIQSTNVHASPGNNYTYVITANNNSPISGTHVKVSYTIPLNLVYIPQPADKGTVAYDPSTRLLTWSIGQLKENEPTQLIVPVQVLVAGTVQSVVDIKGREPDPIMENNVDQAVQQVYPLIVPNAFTPNGDGKNDTFTIPGLETYSDTELTIINRWGNTVYEKVNYQNDWTGENLVEGTYFYILRAKNKSGVWDVYKGYITLLRTKLQ